MLRNTFFMQPEAEIAKSEISTTAKNDLDPNAVELPVDILIIDGSVIVRTPIVAAGINDVSVSIIGDELTITKSGNLPEDDAEYYIKECYWDRLSRTVTLPHPVDVNSTKATLSDGILTVNLPLIHKPNSKVIRVR